MESYILRYSLSNLMVEKKNIIFALVSAAIFMDMMVYTLVIPVLPSYSLKLGADTVTIGIIYGAFSVALLISGIPVGILSDRWGRRLFMMLGMLSLASANLVFAVSDNVGVLIAARLIQGISGAATWSSGLAMLADTFGPEERGQRLGLAMSVMSVGTLLGPAFGGILYDNLGYSATFIIPSVMAFVVGISFLLISDEKYQGAPASLRQRLSPIFDAPRMFSVIAFIIVVGAATYGILEPYMPVYLYGSFSATPTAIGLAFGALSLLSIIVQPVVGKLYDSRGGRPLIAAGLIASAAIVVFVTAMPSFLSTAAVFSLLGITMGFALTPMLPLLSDLYGGEGESNSRGLVYGIYNTLFSLGLAIGPFAGGLLIVSISFPRTLQLQALFMCAAGICAYVFIRQAKKREG
jgi:DHA1 family multidrug resistance protein-like MFS transporter